jgi:hypothetical protein
MCSPLLLAWRNKRRTWLTALPLQDALKFPECRLAPWFVGLVIPAKAGIQCVMWTTERLLDPGFRRGDEV